MQINEIRITGNAARAAEVKTTAQGKRIVSFTVGHTSKSKEGDRTTWIKVTAFENESFPSKITCDDAARVDKGNHVYVEGKFSIREYTGKDGTLKSSLEVTANRIGILLKAPKPFAPLPTQDYDLGEVPF